MMLLGHGSVLACALLVVHTALGGGLLEVAGSAGSAGGLGLDRSRSGHDLGFVDAKVSNGVMELDSIAPRERPPAGSDGQPSPRRKGAKAPRVRIGVEATRGIPVDVISRILRQSSGRYRDCYQRGLKRRPDLQGEVKVRFVIERDGRTSNSRDGGSPLPDVSVIRCMASAVEGLAFPKPWEATDDGTMTVLMHLWLSLE